MKKILFLVAVLILVALSIPGEQVDHWANLRYLIGTWKMEKPDVTNIQQYSFLFKGKFIQMKTRAVFKLTAKRPEVDIHEDLNIFSYDGTTDTLMLRSFHSEGFVNIFTLSGVSEDGKILTFTTRVVENAPEGTKAKLILQKISDTEMIEKFFVAWPNKDYNCMTDNLLKKVN
jgi:hypothetical protein